MTIRQETTSDASAVYELVKTAFSSAEHSDGNEQDLVVLLHKAPLSACSSLVAEENGKSSAIFSSLKSKSEKNSHCSCATGSTARTAKKKALGLHCWQKVTALPKILAMASVSYWQ